VRCLRFDISRNLQAYADGELEAVTLARVEAHLFDCAPCRRALGTIQDAQRFAARLPRRKPPGDPWAGIQPAVVGRENTGGGAPPGRGVRPGVSRRTVWLTLSTAAAGLVVSLILIANLGVSQRPEPSWKADLVRDEFHKVSISRIVDNTEPHVVAEGFVSQISIEEDGDRVFRLVEDLRRPEPFIVCEIISPIAMTLPRVGSHVRVYGVSRYDDKANHQWYEVHPVLNIETLND
jgi:Putative zinc-finger